MSNSRRLQTNFVFNILLTLSTYFAQLVVYPYVSRVLGVDYMGVVGFVNKSIDVFLIFSTLGIATVGVREIAFAKNDKQRLNNTFSFLVSYMIVTTIIVSIIYLLCILFITKFNFYSNLFYIGLAKLLFSTFLIEWFYQGIEDFKYITVCSVFVKILYILSIFLFVKTKEDVDIYFILTTLVIVLNGIINWFASRKYVRFKFSMRSFKIYNTPMISFGVYQMLNAAFSTCNYMFLGFICESKEVGYYYTAENFYFILLACISAFTRVMLPRMSTLLAEDKIAEFNRLIEKSIGVVLSVCIPITIFGVANANHIIHLFSGDGYEGAVLPMQIMLALIFINSINQVFIVQIATPLKKDKEILFGSLVATILALSINYFMIKTMGAVGCSIVLVVSVVVANIYPIYILFKQHYIEKSIINVFVKQLLLSLPYFLIAILLVLFNNIITMIVCAVLFALYFYIIQGRKLIKSYINHSKN